MPVQNAPRRSLRLRGKQPNKTATKNKEIIPKSIQGSQGDNLDTLLRNNRDAFQAMTTEIISVIQTTISKDPTNDKR